jgi:uncharacterized protein (UPF0276 family)
MASLNTKTIAGSGLGLRRDMVSEWQSIEESWPEGCRRPDFIEIAPENWMGFGGKFSRDLRFFTERYPVAAHGLSLSIGGPDPLDEGFVRRLAEFLDSHQVQVFSEHLSYCTDGGHLYDLMPIPFTEGAVRWVGERIRRIQDLMGRRIAVENVSYYAAPGAELSEIEFINAVVEEADCGLLLDVNNVYVNSVNFGYDPIEFLRQIPADRVDYMHIAGHLQQSADLIIDTHGADVIEPVWALLSEAFSRMGDRPVLLERDFNLPPMQVLLSELAMIDHHRVNAFGGSLTPREGVA